MSLILKNVIMKKIFYILLLSLSFINCKAQTISMTTTNYNNIPNGAYIKDLDGKLNSFAGTWKWTNGSDEFILKLVKVEMYNSSGLNEYYEDKIMGGYKFTQSGIEIVNTLTFNTSFNPNDITTFDSYAPILSNLHSPFDTLTMIFSDKIKGKVCHASLELISPLVLPNGNFSSTQAQFKLWNRETWNINGDNPVDQSFILPTNIIMTKID